MFDVFGKVRNRRMDEDGKTGDGVSDARDVIEVDEKSSRQGPLQDTALAPASAPEHDLKVPVEDGSGPYDSADHKDAVNEAPSSLPSSPDDDPDPDTFPDGGLRAWLVVFGASCAFFIVFGLANSTAAFQEILYNDILLGYSADAIGWIFSVNLFMTFLGGIYIGVWFDAYGPRAPVLVGCIGMVAGLMLLGLCTRYWHFILDYGLLCGVSGALISTPAFASLAHFFKRRRGLAAGIASAVGSIGGIALPLVISGLLPRLGFGWTTRVIGFIFLALSIPANLFLAARLPPRINRVSVVPDLTPLKNPRLALCTAGIFLMEWAVFTPLAYIGSYASGHGQSTSFAFLIVTLLNVGSFFGRLIPGYLADRFGRFNVIVCTIACCAASVFALWLPARDDAALMVAFAVVFGVAQGSNFGLIPVCLAELCHVGEYGRYYAASYFVVSFGTLTSVPIAGSLIAAAGGEYWGLIIFSGLSYIGALMFYAATRVLSVGWSPKVRF